MSDYLKHYKEEIIALLKSDINTLIELVNSMPYGRFKEDSFEYVLIDHLTLVLNLLESDMKTDDCEDCLVNEISQ